jgi:hypothetical protein
VEASGALNAPERETPMSAFIVNTNVMAKVLTAILLVSLSREDRFNEMFLALRLASG